MTSTEFNYTSQQFDDENQKSLSMLTDGLTPSHFDQLIKTKNNYNHLLDKIKLKIKSNENILVTFDQIDGIVDYDDEKNTKTCTKKREFFHSTNNYNYLSVS